MAHPPTDHVSRERRLLKRKNGSKPHEATAPDIIIRDFIDHVRGIIPVLENVKTSIEESSGRIPRASKQLSEVTVATESATVEILNVLEATTESITRNEPHLAELRAFVQDAPESSGKTRADEAIRAVEELLARTKDSSMNIAIALQVQDITSQQIAGVAHTIESIRKQLGHALQRLDGSVDPSAVPPPLPPDPGPAVHFDAEARFSKETHRQDLADELVKQWAEHQAPPAPSSEGSNHER